MTSEAKRVLLLYEKNWMQSAFKPSNRGKLHKALDVPEDETIPKSKLNKAAKAGGKLGQRARAAKNANEGLGEMEGLEGLSILFDKGFDRKDDEDDGDEMTEGVWNGYGRARTRESEKQNPKDTPCMTCGTQNSVTKMSDWLGHHCSDCATKTKSVSAAPELVKQRREKEAEEAKKTKAKKPKETSEAVDWEKRKANWAAWKKENPGYVPKYSEYTKANLKKKAKNKPCKSGSSCDSQPKDLEDKAEKVVETKTNEATDWLKRKARWDAHKKAKADKCDASCNCQPRGDNHEGDEPPKDCACDKCFQGSGQCTCGHKTCKG